MNPPELIHIPEKMRVGVELEYYGAPSTCICGFTTHHEKTIESAMFSHGTEIVSPILDSNTINNVPLVAGLVKDAGGRVNHSCSVHVHIDSKYLDVYDKNGNIDIEATKIFWKNFLEMWSACERNIYSLVNKAGENSRPLGFAMPVASSIEYIFSKKIMEQTDLESFKGLIRIYQEECDKGTDPRYFSVNFSNLDRTDEEVKKEEIHTGKGTFEFRAANSNLEPEELALTIQLYANFMEMSRELGLIEVKTIRGQELTDKEKTKWNIRNQIIENQELTRDDKCKLMLDLMFENEKNKSKYEERYEKNKNDYVVMEVYGENSEIFDIYEYGNLEENDGIIFNENDYQDICTDTINRNPNMIQMVRDSIKNYMRKFAEKFLR